METGTAGRWWAFCAIILIATLAGCTTNVTPPSGPAGTEVCFDPAPITFPDLYGEIVGDCGWWVDFQSSDEHDHTYTYERCVTIPPQFLPGDLIFMTVTGDTADGFFKCKFVDFFQDILWVPGFKLFGSFVVTE